MGDPPLSTGGPHNAQREVEELVTSTSVTAVGADGKKKGMGKGKLIVKDIKEDGMSYHEILNDIICTQKKKNMQRK